MLKQFAISWKKKLFKFQSFFIAKLIQSLMHLLIKTCRLQIEGLESFYQLAVSEKCLLMLWHNRLAIAPFILSHYTPQIQYTALISGSRDADILNTIVNSYQNGNTLRVSHLARYQALHSIIRHLEERKSVVIITPDGPRGPRYEMKPGLAIAALETQAHVVPLNWEANRYWELKTWDRLRIPKPFSTIKVTFDAPIRLDTLPSPLLEQAKIALKEKLPRN